MLSKVPQKTFLKDMPKTGEHVEVQAISHVGSENASSLENNRFLAWLDIQLTMIL